MGDDTISPRVNAARLPNFVGRPVRLPCKFLRQKEAGKAIVEASDGGQVEIIFQDDKTLEGTFFEIIGHAQTESSIKCWLVLSLDSDKGVDMKLVNDVVELTFHPKLKKIFPA